MAVNQPDNIATNHPKTVWEGYRKLVNGVYVDYDDIADVQATVKPEFIKNKTYRIAGVDMFTPDGEQFIGPSFQNMSEFFQIV